MFSQEELAILKNAFSAIHWTAYHKGNTRLKDLEVVINMLAEKIGSEKTDYSKYRDK